jgi:16S rRNA (adenine1518-N6/adenine1519-N6)-dimethyltransferase
MNLLSTIKKELNIPGIKPKKSLGQNFLVNKRIYQKIIAALEIKRDEEIIEIGPGLGTLTSFLAESKAKVIAVEKDHKLVDYLKNKFAGQENVKIVEGDVLRFDPKSYKLKAISYKLVGNIPYYISSHLLRMVFEKWPCPKAIVLMLQKEVAQRITAKPPNMSLLAVSVQYYSKPEIISYVPGQNFYPAPEVDSAIIKLVPGERFTAYSDNAENPEKAGGPRGFTGRKLKTENFFRIVRAGFSGKRKQLINNLARGLKIKKGTIERELKAVGIDPRRRAETLALEEWQKVTNVLSLPR